MTQTVPRHQKQINQRTGDRRRRHSLSLLTPSRPGRLPLPHDIDADAVSPLLAMQRLLPPSDFSGGTPTRPDQSPRPTDAHLTLEGRITTLALLLLLLPPPVRYFNSLLVKRSLTRARRGAPNPRSRRTTGIPHVYTATDLLSTFAHCHSMLRPHNAL